MRIADINPTTAAAMPPAKLGVQRPGPCIHELFEQQVERHPDAVAVVHDGESLTYRELDDRADRLAHHLRSLGVGPDVLVGLCLERGFTMIVGLLGILKAGGAYVPLDPSYPQERLAMMLHDAAAPVLVTERRLGGHLPPTAGHVVCLDEPLPAFESVEVGAQPAPQAEPENLAYVIFTSGSTGRPKGVLVTHRNVVRLMQATHPWFHFDERDVWTMFHSVTFDFSVWEIYGALLYGGRLIIVPYLVSRSPEAFYDLLVAEQVTVLNQTPTAFQQLMRVDASDDGTRPLALRLVIFGGEKLQMASLAAWFARHGDVRPQLVNMYGITETTVHVTYRPLTAADVRAPSMIGVPIPDLQVHLLDEDLQPVAEGAPGELFVGGAGVARGYLNRPELTAERFIPNPFRDDPHARLYRTGDRGRRLPEGDIEYLGRADDQLKIRGFRIEPGEIEAALLQVEGIRQAAVVPRDVHPGDTRLLACLVGQSDVAAEPSIRAALSQTLPDHMLPARYVWLESMPLTASGKLDRRALPAWSAEAVSQNAAEVDVAPCTPLEQKLAAIWCDLLALDGVGVHDNFFELGGDSLVAMQVVATVRQSLGVTVPVGFFYANPTLARLAEAITTAADGAAAHEEKSAAPVINPVTAGPRTIPATAAQQRLWFLQQLAPDSAGYTIGLVHRVRGPLDVGALGVALDRIVARHEALRTTFALVDGEVVQTVAKAGTWPLDTLSAAVAAESGREAAAISRLKNEFRRPFDLENGPLVRCCVVDLAPDEHILAFFIQHVIFDGWSVGVLYRELAACYAALLAGREPALPPLLPGASISAQKTAGPESPLLAAQQHYWRSQLADAPTHLTLPTDKPRPPVESFRGALATKSLDPAVTARLFALARSESSTPFSVLFAAFMAVLGRWSDAHDLVVGTPYADREHSHAAGMIGFLVNTLAIRVDLSGNPSFRNLLSRVRTSLLGAFAHAQLPFERVVELLGARRDAGRSPLFQVMFAWQDDSDVVLRLPELAAEPLTFDGGVSHFDMTLFAVRTSHGIELRLEYATDLFEAATAMRMLDSVAALLAAATADPDRPIGSLAITTPAEEATIIALGSSIMADRELDATLGERFAAQASRTPAAIAVSCDGRRVTYGELDAEANRLANHLLASGAMPGDFVGVLLDRSVDFVVAVLGILKAGCAYAPLPTEYPDERLAFMIADMGMKLLVTERPHADRLPEAGVGRVFMASNEPWQQGAPAAAPVCDAAATATAESPAYVMYTSGSTGRPKGVVVPHRAVVRLVTAQSYAPFGPEMRTLLLAPTAFDASTFELWAPLLHGGTCVVFPDRHPDLDRLGHVIRDERVNCLWLTAGLFNHVIDFSPEILATVGHVLTGGDVLSVPHVRKAISLLPQTRLINGYGPTESTTFACAHPIGRDETFPHGTAPIGRPLIGTSCCIVDESLKPVPIGMPGELLIGGAGLAIRYLNQPELTAAKFIPDPFSATPGARLYRTGDRCRWLPDGTIEFLGRQDGQVKIRGHRVETGEIEAALADLPGVDQAVVVVCDREQTGGGTQKVLRACVVPRPEATLDLAALRRDLVRRLPEPMVPGEWLVLESLPLTAQGKLDRGGLASAPLTVCPDVDGPSGPRDDAAPRTLLEWEIAKIWQRLFGRDHIDITADFFELGGHSLLAAQLAVELDRLLGRRVPIATLFRAPTVASLARTLADESWLPAWTSLVPLKPTGSRAPLYLLHGLGGDVMHFVGFARLLAADQPVYGVRAVDVDGRSPPLNTLDEMAAHYAREIRAFQPVGPYRLGGYSLAGCMAWAVAMELRGQGQEVTVLIFDTLPKFRLPWAASCVRAMIKPLMLLSELGSRGVRQWPRHVAARLEEFLRPAYLAAPQGPRDAVVADRPQVVWKDRYFMTVMPFSARRITARVELFLCQEPFMQRLMSWGIATIWRLLTQGPVNVHKLQYRHEDIFSNDTLPRVAALVDKVLADEHRPETPVGGRS